MEEEAKEEQKDEQVREMNSTSSRGQLGHFSPYMVGNSRIRLVRKETSDFPARMKTLARKRRLLTTCGWRQIVGLSLGKCGADL